MDSKATIETGILYRTATLQRSADDTGQLVTASISSEIPYQRSWGIEILSHDPSHVNLSRVERGAVPFLADHDTKKLIGKVQGVQLVGDRAVSTIKMGNSPLAKEIYADIKDQIRTEVSIGYKVNQMELIDTDKGVETYRVIDWELLHVASVAEPADPTVGIGRSQENKTTTVVIRNIKGVKMTEQEILKKERNRVSDITVMGRDHGCKDEAAEFIEDGKSSEQFRLHVLNLLKARGLKPLELREQDPTKSSGQDASILGAIQAQIPGMNDSYGAGRALEMSQEVQTRTGKKPQGIFVPVGDVQKRGLVVGTATAGGHTVATDLLTGSFIDQLHSMMMVKKMGAKMLTGLEGNVAIPRQTESATAQWVAEGGVITPDDQAFDQVTMSPKSVGARTEISRKMLKQSSLDVENFVRGDLAKVIALAIDLAAINGSGASNQPEGILNTTGIGAVAGGTNGLAPTWDHVVALMSAVANDNALTGALGYLTNTSVIGKLMVTEKVATTGEFIVKEMAGPDGLTGIGGTRCGVSNQVPSTLDKGTSTGVCSAIIYGNWADLIIGQWGGLDVLVDPYTDSNKGQVNITALMDLDIAVRHAESFAAMKDVLTA